MIKARPVIFPGDAGGQFDQLSLIEMLEQSREQRIRHLDWSSGHCLGVFEHKLFQRRKSTTLPENG